MKYIQAILLSIILFSMLPAARAVSLQITLAIGSQTPSKYTEAISHEGSITQRYGRYSYCLAKKPSGTGGIRARYVSIAETCTIEYIDKLNDVPIEESFGEDKTIKLSEQNAKPLSLLLLDGKTGFLKLKEMAVNIYSHLNAPVLIPYFFGDCPVLIEYSALINTSHSIIMHMTLMDDHQARFTIVIQLSGDTIILQLHSGLIDYTQIQSVSPLSTATIEIAQYDPPPLLPEFLASPQEATPLQILHTLGNSYGASNIP